MGWFQEKTPLPGWNGRLAYEVDLCSRNEPSSSYLSLPTLASPANKKNIFFRKAKNELNLSFLICVESEFILLKQTNPIEAVNNHGWSNPPPCHHVEAAPGQYEVVTGPLGPLQAADAPVHTRETIYNVASKYGLMATFAPRVYKDSCTSLSSPFRYLTKPQTQADAQHTHIYPFTPPPRPPPRPPPHQT